jgi:hypothetical protein
MPCSAKIDASDNVVRVKEYTKSGLWVVTEQFKSVEDARVRLLGRGFIQHVDVDLMYYRRKEKEPK